MRSSIARWGALCLFLAASLVSGAPAGAVPAQPNDPGFALQWNLQMIGAPAAWQRGTGLNITIAIVDSGVDLTHDDLKDKIIGHADCVGAGASGACKTDPTSGQDDNGHGTHVAGIAAAITDNHVGVAGVAPDASLLDVKVLSQSCDAVMGCDATGTTEDVAAGIRYAADHGASVINLSLGNASQSLFGPAFQTAIDYAFNKGAIPVIAAGNDFVLPSGGALNALVVGALDKDGSKSQYGNSIGDAQWALMAPGGEPDTADSCQSNPSGVLSTYSNNGYACLAGTSMAAPHVAGAAAILRSMNFSQQDTINRLLSTAKKMEPAAVYGSGELDLSAATGATTPTTQPPETTTPDQSASSTGPASSTSLDSSAPPAPSSSSSQAPPVSPPSGDLSGPTSTAPAGVITLPNQRAAARPGGTVTVHTPSKGGDVSAGLVAAAVALAAGVSCAVGMFFLRGSSWTRRTPKPPPPPPLS